jgi:hypothetical protein
LQTFALPLGDRATGQSWLLVASAWFLAGQESTHSFHGFSTMNLNFSTALVRSE